MVVCSSCGTADRPGRKFCVGCGRPMAAACPRCGSATEQGERFCGECGSPLSASAGAAASSAGGVPVTPAAVAERRMVSVLFADLVGFTRIAEGRDPEETRELLARYFETAREIIERYAGTVEKFIGDAVMAVWGSPVAQEDDAERAVRAALDLVAAIPSLGPGIEARAGVLTGEAVVTLGASNQGMVAGDLVNTASRLQAAAAPGSVLVGETTRRTAGPAIAFEPAGEQVLKGKTLPVPAFRALRVVGELGGRNRSETLEAPFVGRDDELRLLKDLFHATTREGRARLVSVIGPAGIGKTRLAWEFSKYIDGLAEAVWWHVGRSPAYGEGISFWALGEMIRGRCGLLETDDDTTTRAKVAAMLREHLPDEAERRWVEGAVLALLGVGGATTGSAELFGAWRTLFERLSLSGTVALVFEDFNNADPGLIDFVDHLLEWSRGHPIYVLTLARPELLERRPDWHAKRNFASVSLEPLSDAAILELLGGLVPGLPESAVRSIVARADGMPLYAVETVRMLLAEGKLELREGQYVPVGDLTDLAVPATLTSLIASRLDSLDAADRALVQDAAVLGQSFTRAGLAAVSGVAGDSLEPHLRGLVRREILTQTVDPRSPELGRFSFVQGLIREVAYNTLARADRKARHLAAARFFETLGSDELAGALAGHYLDAHRNASAGAEAEALAGQARVALRAAAGRAISLGSYEQAARFCEEALTVTEDPGERADLLERAGGSWSKAAHHEAASARLREAIDLHSAAGDRRATARAIASLARSLVSAHQTDDARALLEHAVEEFADLEGEPEGVALRVVFARAAMAGEHYAQAVALADQALAVGERLDLPQLVAQALMARGAALETLGRPYEGGATIRAGIELAEANGASEDALIGRVAHMASTGAGDPIAALEMGRAGLVEARRLGERARAIAFAGNAADAARWTGDWSLALGELDSFLEGDLDGEDRIWLLETEIVLRSWRGEHVEVQAAELRGLYDRVTPDWREVGRSDMEACLRLADGRLAEARAAAHELARLSPLNAPTAFVVAAHAALWARDATALREDLDAMDAVGLRGPVMRLRKTAFSAGLAALEGLRSEARALYAEACRGLLDRGISFEAALVAIDMATVLGSDDADAVTVMADARVVLERLGALPFLERLDALERVDAAEDALPGRDREGERGTRQLLGPR